MSRLVEFEMRRPEDRDIPPDLDGMMEYLRELVSLGGLRLNGFFDAVEFAVEHGRVNPAIPWKIDPKTNEVSLKIDHGIDTDIKDNFRKRFSRVRYFGEELVDDRLDSTDPDYLRSLDEVLLIVDPLDGTDNFKNADPYFSIAGAFFYRRHVVGAVIGEPQEKNQLRIAQADKPGAFLAGKRMRVDKTADIGDVRFGTAFAWNRNDRAQNQVLLNAGVIPFKQVINGAGSVHDIAKVGEGQLTMHASIGLKPGDTAASSLYVEQGGGKVTTIYNGSWDPFCRSTYASNGILHDEGATLFIDALKKAEEQENVWTIRRPKILQRRKRFGEEHSSSPGLFYKTYDGVRTSLRNFRSR